MIGDSVIDCPACAGPDAIGGNCATCNGTTTVNQNVYDEFVEKQRIQNELIALQQKLIEEILSTKSVEELKETILKNLV